MMVKVWLMNWRTECCRKMLPWLLPQKVLSAVDPEKE
jgi:hypothetical protein